jgi:hypothetical protein
MVLLLFESQRCVLSLLVSDWLYQVSYFYLFLHLVFCTAQIFFFFCAFGVLCSVGFMPFFFFS